MKKLTDQKKLLYIIGCSSIYLVNDFNTAIITYGSILVLFIGIYKIITTNNRNYIGVYFITFFVGLEIFLRLSKSGIFWEFSKYCIIILTFACLITEKKTHPYSKFFLLFILVQLPSILLLFRVENTDPVRELIASGLSGPITLGFLSIYLYKKKIPYDVFMRIFFIQITSFLPTLIHLVVNFNRLSEIEFSTNSNASLSGGFGPNQMSSALGYAVLIIFLLNILGGRFYKSVLVDWGLAGGFALFGLFTFSRGGIISAALSITAAFFTLYITKGGATKNKKPKIIIFVMAITCVWAWNYANDFSGGNLALRYKKTAGLDDKYAFTGRRTLLEMEIQIFKDNLIFGIGPGMTRLERFKYGWMAHHTSHTEFTRLLAEHGLFGVCALFILAFSVFQYLRTTKAKADKIKFIGLVSYSFLTMSHSAMRLSIPAFCFALAFVTILPNLIDQENQRK